MIVHQVLPRLAVRDAIGAHTVLLHETLRDAGIGGSIFAAEADAPVAPLTRPYTELGDDSGAWLLYHASIGTHLARWYAHRPERKLVDYHNVTPAEYFSGWEPDVGVLLAAGREQLVELAAACEFGLADSAFNEQELHEAGFARTAVAPVLVDTDALRTGADGALTARLAQGKRGADWLFVGRLAPNKAQHELVKAFALYRRAWDPGARLWLVGGESSAHYRAALERFVHELGLTGAVTLAGSVSNAELSSFFAAADVFVCMSRHEGFCVPLLEAMAWDLPIVARAGAAVGETLGDGGLLLAGDASAATVAAAVARVAGDADVAAALARAGRRRLGELSLDRARQRWLDVLLPIVTGDAAAA